MESQFNLFSLLTIIGRWKKHVIIACVTAMALTYIVTHPKLEFVPPSYESISTIFPANPSLTDRPYLFKTESSGDMSYELFGSDEDIDRIISIAKSSQIITYIIYKFNLINHYEIDTTKEHFLSKTIDKFKKNYEVAKNEYNAIEIHVTDKDKNMAANISNAVVEKTDNVVKEMVLKNRIEILNIFKVQLGNKTKEVDALTDSMAAMREKYRVYNFETQSEVLTTEITETEGELSALKAEQEMLSRKLPAGNLEMIKLNAKIKGLEKKLTSLTSDDSNNEFNLKSFTQGSDKISVLHAKLIAATEELRVLNIAYEQYSVATNPNMSSIYVMEKAYPAEKAIPIQILSTIAALLITFFVTITIVTILDRKGA